MVRLPYPAYRPVADVLVLAGVAAVVAVALQVGPVRASLPASANELLTLSAAAVGAVAAILAGLASRLLDDLRQAWIAAALGLYSAVVLPWSTVLAAQQGGPQRAPLLIVYSTALVLLTVSIRPPAPLGRWGGWVIAGAGGALAVLALSLPDAAALRGFADGPVPTLAALIGWTAAAVAFVVDALRARSAPGLRLGLGLVVLAVAQLHRVASAAPSLAFAGLRLVGLAVVLLALVQIVAQALGKLQSRNWEQQEELVAAALHLERAREMAAERDHELRNGLAGLAGITHLLSAPPGDEQHGPLKQAVLAELGRLLTLVDGVAAEPDGAGYPVQQVLADRIALRDPGAAPVGLRVEPGLRAAGEPDVLAQVVANLLANCDRHAPGAPITVTARGRDGQVLVEVRDEGPGLPADLAGSVLERGIRDEAAGGAGLGLHISAQALARAGGSLTVRTVEAPQGCLAEVAVPEMAAGTSHRPVVARNRPSAV